MTIDFAMDAVRKLTASYELFLVKVRSQNQGNTVPETADYSQPVRPPVPPHFHKPDNGHF
ncbi:hypothetical protein THII_0992 [Thioploca ingrica]|uniref:Uncharacterized protein n=1 Tax=Thioploca ingrica TaxID=40754 RepID=A0A090AEC9_9GAMM|nr:hypothetical protein THII_0992 [Thioploca ingrica]